MACFPKSVALLSSNKSQSKISILTRSSIRNSKDDKLEHHIRKSTDLTLGGHADSAGQLSKVSHCIPVSCGQDPLISDAVYPSFIKEFIFPFYSCLWPVIFLASNHSPPSRNIGKGTRSSCLAFPTQGFKKVEWNTGCTRDDASGTLACTLLPIWGCQT